MYKQLSMIGLLTAAAISPAFAAPASPAETSLRQVYGANVQLQKLQQWTDNGVAVEYYGVHMNGGLASATVTSRGDLITTGVPAQASALPPAVQQTVGLFQTPPSHLVQQDTHNYYLSAKGPGNLPYVIEVNAVGKIIQIKSPQQIHEDAGTQQKTAVAQLPAQVVQVAKQRFSGTTIDGGAPAKHDPGYYSVYFHNANGHGWAILNANNDVLQWRNAVALTSLPPAVMNTINTQLKGDQITNVTMGDDRLFQITDKLGDETMVMYVRPNGEIAWMNGRSAGAKKAK